MMLFIVLLLGLLWLFQVVFFGEIYKAVRISEIKGCTADICERIELSDAEIKTAAAEISDKKHICVLVFDERGMVIANNDVLTDCVIHTMPSRNIYMLYDLASREGGEKLSRFNPEGFHNMHSPGNFRVPGIVEDKSERNSDNSTESIIFTKIVRSESRKRDVVVMLNATVSPVASTVRTLTTELIIISAVMVLIAVLLSYVLAKRISRPIVRVNQSAKQLAGGNYSADFSADGYREIAELSDTLAYAADELSKTDALKRELIANISHDLRTPLTMITGYAEVMRDIPGENTPENVQIIIDEAQRLSSLVNDLLDISRIQSGTQTLDLSDFNLTETVKEVIGRFSKLTDADGYTISFDCDCDVVVRADHSRILQVIYNFINNAITHAGADKAVFVSQRVLTASDGRRVRIEVTDNGEGIPPESIPYIWDRYYKVDKLHRRTLMGSGLGLSIVKGILELHHAEYGVISREGEGSTFWFELR